MVSTALRSEQDFRHEAFMYAGLDEFVRGASAFIRDGLDAGEPTLVVVSAEKIELLRRELGDDAGDVLFADMAEVGANPARIIPAWRDFVAEHADPGRGVRGIGEPIDPDRGPAELVECHRHEALLNVAFADTPGFRLMCPYDTTALHPAVVAHAHETHPLIVDGGAIQPSDRFPGLTAVRAPFDDPLPEPTVEVEELEVDVHELPAARELVSRFATAARLSADRASELVIAVNEIATNSVRHGGGSGVLRLWREPDAVVCEVRDSGRIEPPLVGRERPVSGQIGGYGLWLANQVCDLVQVRSFRTGSAVRVHMRLS
jgi:anti-sigma regulatory factor (Ser/Thr protein kinase)